MKHSSNFEDALCGDAPLPRLEIDHTDYIEEIEALKLSEEEAEEFLKAMWNAMRMIVEMGLELREFPVLAEDVGRNAGQEAGNSLEMKCDVFNDAAVSKKGKA